MGTLYLVATPIGNLEDITLRALRILRAVPLIAAEDTRHTRKLLSHYQISTPMTSYHEHSPDSRRAALLQALAQGDVAVVSDAFSDPGQELVREAIAAGYPVVAIPGPVAAVTALVASGLPTDSCLFLGFLPRRPAERRQALERVRAAPHTLVLYEAPHRVLACLDDLLATLGDRQAAIAREVTKLHEQWLRGLLSEVRAQLAAAGTPRGEFVLVVAGATPEQALTGQPVEARETDEDVRARLRSLLAAGVGTREAAAQVAKATGWPRRTLYRLALTLTSDADGEKP
jgi:16S rRNA (cytidine1402-2'-O)-methyltransferase